VLRAALPGYAPPLTRAFSPCDITAARCDLGFRPTPLADWLGETARWSAAHRAGTPSTGYDRRADEVALARRYRDRLAALTAEFTA
jgi:hypothetical protein